MIHKFDKTIWDAARSAKAQSILDNLPTRAAAMAAINNIATLAGAKEFLLKSTDVLYWLAKDQRD